MVEQSAVNRRVAGSSPASGAESQVSLVLGAAVKIISKSLLVLMLVCVSHAYSWQGDPWASITRDAITAGASQMIDSSWTPLNTFTNYPGARTYYAGQTYKGELYSNTNHQNWLEFQSAINNTPGGTTYYGDYCSGLVNISWRLPKFYSIPSIISNLGGSYFYALGEAGDGPFVSLKQGDAFYISGHIFLFNRYKADGTIETMEQIAPTARRRTWSWNALRTFRPIRRNLVAGAIVTNDRVETSYTVPVRTAATFTASSLWTAPITAQGTVVEGPLNNEQYRWWKVKFDRSAVSGWVTEGYLAKLNAKNAPCAGSDATRPSGTVAINSGATYANSRGAMLTLVCNDSGSGCASMRFSDDNAGWSDWEPFATAKQWVLSSGEGAKSVYVQFQDGCGNTSASAGATVRSQTSTPDFVVASLSAPAAAAIGATIPITEVTANTGAGGANISTTTFFFSADNSLDSADTVLGARPIPALSFGATNAGNTSLAIPQNLAPGVFYLIAKANSVSASDDCQYINPCGSLIESSRTNNYKISKITVGPDLTVSALTLALADGTMKIAESVRNGGGDAAGSSVVRFYLSTDSLLDTQDPLLGSRYIPVLGPSATSSGTTSVAIPPGLAAGLHYVIAKADSGNDVLEASENNNVRSRTFNY